MPPYRWQVRATHSSVASAGTAGSALCWQPFDLDIDQVRSLSTRQGIQIPMPFTVTGTTMRFIPHTRYR